MHTRQNLVPRTSSSLSPITPSVTIPDGCTVLVVLMKVRGATNRAGGSLTLSGGDPNAPGTVTLLQANSTQKAATSPEASAELWYYCPVVSGPKSGEFTPGTYTLTIPNTGAAICFYTVEAGVAGGDAGRSEFDGANGGNNTSTNPTPGAVTVTAPGGIGWAITAGGWTTWAPAAQAGTAIANTDDGADGGGEQYVLNPPLGAHTLSWTFATSDDWGGERVLPRGGGGGVEQLHGLPGRRRDGGRGANPLR